MMFMYIRKFLSKPVHPGSLALFRVMFGLIVLWKALKYLTQSWIPWFFEYPDFNFTYGFFEWVSPLPLPVLYVLFGLAALFSVFVILGIWYRISTSLLLVIQLYFFLLEQAHYLNHEYLLLIINFLMIFLPADRHYTLRSLWSTDAESTTIPYWTVLLLQVQIGIVYFFGGIAKLKPDWLSGSPMNIWLPDATDFPVIGHLFNYQEIALLFSWSGLLLDLLAFPLLMIRRTRPWMAMALILFHLTNDRLFHIGIFPWFMIGALLIYLPASWPGQLLHRLRNGGRHLRLKYLALALFGAASSLIFHEAFSVFPVLISALGFVLVGWDLAERPDWKHSTSARSTSPAMSNATLYLLTVWLLIQTIVPVRHFFIPGNPSWTEEGHRFSWQMMLRTKECHDQFYTWDFEEEVLVPIPRGKKLWEWQHNVMVSRPNMIIQYARVLSEAYDNRPIFADIECSLNGAEPRRLLVRTTDLTRVTFHDYRPNDWIYR